MKVRTVTTIAVLLGLFVGIVAAQPLNAAANDYIRVYVNGREVQSEVPAQIVNGRTLLPVRAVSEALDMDVIWDEINRTVMLKSPIIAPASKPAVSITPTPATTPEKGYTDNYDIQILGESVATSVQLRAALKKNNPAAPDLVDLYLQIGKEYGIRGDLAFCQAAKETGWWRYGNLVQLEQNNYCGLGATGSPATGEENLNGANPNRVWYIEGRHGAFFKTPADGVEAQIQHLYAYATKNPLPAGKEIVDPRFTLVTRGIAPKWIDLNGRWAVPGTNYGQSIISDYLGQAIPLTAAEVLPNETGITKTTGEDLLDALKRENALLKAENEELRRQLK